MRIREFSEIICRRTGVPALKIDKILQEFWYLVKDGLVEGKRVHVPPIGTFWLKKKPDGKLLRYYIRFNSSRAANKEVTFNVHHPETLSLPVAKRPGRTQKNLQAVLGAGKLRKSLLGKIGRSGAKRIP